QLHRDGRDLHPVRNRSGLHDPVGEGPQRVPSDARGLIMPKTAIVTGASRGIGAAVARRLASDGWAIVVNYRTDRDAAERIATQISSAGGTAVALPADVSKEDEVAVLFQTTVATFGPIGALVNNA